MDLWVGRWILASISDGKRLLWPELEVGLGWVGLPPQSRVRDFLSVADIPEDKTEIGAESNVFRDYNFDILRITRLGEDHLQLDLRSLIPHRNDLKL